MFRKVREIVTVTDPLLCGGYKRFRRFERCPVVALGLRGA
jgi:hypothetical protein